MEKTIKNLKKIIVDYTPLLNKISDAEYILKTVTGKWSKKELLGHLIDSAQNNIRRFVMAQYEEQPQILYDQDQWVKIANYQQYNIQDLISLWSLLNKHACVILKNIPTGIEKRECLTSELHSIEWIAEDYIKHLLHHLHQILDLEPVPYL